MVHLDYRDARPIYTQIADAFRAQIRAGVLVQEDKLPSVRELATQLAINPNTIQRAYRELEAQGWIASVAGKGSFVCRRADTAAQQALWASFDEAAQALLAAGETPQSLIEHLKQGGVYNA